MNSVHMQVHVCVCACACVYSSQLAVLMLVRWLVLPANGIEMVIRAN